jgi:hypothetical protein
MKFLYWDQAMTAIDTVFSKIDKIKPVSLTYNKEYFEMMNKYNAEL